MANYQTYSYGLAVIYIYKCNVNAIIDPDRACLEMFMLCLTISIS
jgi:hypothetical protein